MNRQDSISRADGWLTAWIGGQLVMMNASSNHYLGLSATGGRIWELLETPQHFSELCEKLKMEFKGEEQTIAADASDFLSRLKEHDAVTVTEGGLE